MKESMRTGLVLQVMALLPTKLRHLFSDDYLMHPTCLLLIQVEPRVPCFCIDSFAVGDHG